MRAVGALRAWQPCILRWMKPGPSLYRRLLREARALPGPVFRKVTENTRQLFDRHRGTAEGERLQRAYADGEAAVRVLRWLAHLPEVIGCGNALTSSLACRGSSPTPAAWLCCAGGQTGPAEALFAAGAPRQAALGGWRHPLRLLRPQRRRCWGPAWRRYTMPRQAASTTSCARTPRSVVAGCASG